MGNNLKLKYVIGAWKDLPGYPTAEDTLYELYEKFDGNRFSELSMNYLWLDSDNKPFWKGTQVEKNFETLIKSGAIDQSTSNNDKIWYKINKHPFA